MNNEPLELVRRSLAECGSNPREASKATRAVIMIDPFPDLSDFTTVPTPRPSLFRAVFQLMGALVMQARFKPEELMLASDEDVRSRLAIVPVATSDSKRVSMEPPLCSAPLYAFAGFFSQAFRRHDFQLGRRNAQQFVRRYFWVNAANALFDPWRTSNPDLRACNLPDSFLARYAVPTQPPAAGTPYEVGQGFFKIALLPLDAGLAKEIPLPSRPGIETVDLTRIDALIERRVRALVPPLKAQILGRWPARTSWLTPLTWLVENRAIAFVVGKCRSIVREGLMPRQG